MSKLSILFRLLLSVKLGMLMGMFKDPDFI